MNKVGKYKTVRRVDTPTDEDEQVRNRSDSETPSSETGNRRSNASDSGHQGLRKATATTEVTRKKKAGPPEKPKGKKVHKVSESESEYKANESSELEYSSDSTDLRETGIRNASDVITDTDETCWTATSSSSKRTDAQDNWTEAKKRRNKKGNRSETDDNGSDKSHTVSVYKVENPKEVAKLLIRKANVIRDAVLDSGNMKKDRRRHIVEIIEENVEFLKDSEIVRGGP